MPRYTTIRVSIEDKKRLERLAKLMGWSLSETLRRAIEVPRRSSWKSIKATWRLF